MKRILASLLRILAGVPIVCLFAGGMLFLVLSASVVGRCVGLSAAIFGAVLFCSVGYWNREWFKRRRRRFLAVLLPLVAGLYVVPAIVSPDGGAADARVRNCFVGGGSHFHRLSPWSIVPESDQLKVGLSMAALCTPEIDSAEAARIGSLVFPLYAEMDKDADFRRLGSVMGLTYRDLGRMPYRTGHYFAFIPETSGNERIPCIVFLHGMGGNVKPCLWVLSKLSSRTKCAVIAPTFGVGKWDRPDAGDFVVDVVRESLATLPLDADRVFLMGYSNGGMGVTRAAVEQPGLFRGLIYLSPVTEDEFFSTPEFLARKADRNILFLQGGRDKRIPPSIVEGTAALLKRLGCNVRLRVYDEEDHYLMFSQEESVLDEIGTFMAASPIAPSHE